MSVAGASDSRVATTAAQATAQRVHHADAVEAERPVYVGFVTRVVAFAIDAALINTVALIVGAVVALCVSLLPASDDRTNLLIAIGGIAWALWVVGYFVVFWTGNGQTPGNRLMQIRVLRADGSDLRPRHALVRLGGIVLSAPLLWGFVPILLTERRRGVHDGLAGTVVTSAPSSRAYEPPARAVLEGSGTERRSPSR